MKGLKQKRRLIGLTQKQLSKSVGISQSYLNKIENNISDPPYELGVKILSYLKKLQNSSGIIAKDVMSKKIFYIKPCDLIKKAAKMMEIYNISQVPIIENNICIGSITSKTLPKLISKGIESMENIIVKDVMEESFPIVNFDCVIKIISSLLENYSAVLVSKKGKLIGIITSHDLYKVIK